MKISKKQQLRIVEVGQMVGEGDDAKKYKLDFSIKSIPRLDKMISDLWKGDPPNDLDTMTFVFGSYVALIVDRSFQGSWTTEKDTNEIVFNSKKSSVNFNPWNWVAKRFELEDMIAPKADFIFKMLVEDKK